MDVHQASGPDGYDLWAALNAGGALLSMLSFASDGKQSKELGLASALLTAESALLHVATTPPRCANCGSRTQPAPAQTGYKWRCPRCGRWIV
jgi:hypothetical protein